MVIRGVLLAVEAVLLLMFVLPLPVICSGNFVGIVACIFLIVITVSWGKFTKIVALLWSKTAGKVGLVAVGILVVAFVIYFIVLSVLMYRAKENETDNPEVLVVLGCKVSGKKPVRMLKARLDAAYEVLQKNKNVKCIVSGGQGSNEIISEAEAMRNYLVEDKGISSDRVIMEDKSTTTYENIKYSLEIMDKLGLEHRMTIVTDGFHEYRAGLIAKAQGVKEVTAYSAHTSIRYLFTYWVREWLGITHFYFLGN